MRRPEIPVYRELEREAGQAQAETPSAFQNPPDVRARYEVLLEVEDRRETDHLVFSRGKDWVYLGNPSGKGHEWSFRRNPMSRAVVTGIRVDHALRYLIGYDSSDLRDSRLALSWDSVQAMSLDPTKFEALDEEPQEAFGHRFDAFSLPVEKGLESTIWWNQDLALALEIRVESPQGRWTRRLVKLEQGADALLSGDPRNRFPNYMEMDLADYREETQCGSCASQSRKTLQGTKNQAPLSRMDMIQRLLQRNKARSAQKRAQSGIAEK